MSIDRVKVSAKARDNLITLKRRTGIENWNVLCRWALCHSLATGVGDPIASDKIVTDSNIDMAWRTFAGSHDELYWALVRERCKQDGLDPSNEEVVAEQFKQHLHRGIKYLSDRNKAQSIAELVKLAVA